MPDQGRVARVMTYVSHPEPNAGRCRLDSLPGVKAPEYVSNCRPDLVTAVKDRQRHGAVRRQLAVEEAVRGRNMDRLLRGCSWLGSTEHWSVRSSLGPLVHGTARIGASQLFEKLPSRGLCLRVHQVESALLHRYVIGSEAVFG
ncbi:hypothetical protein J6590_024631 [Homalodisca vitripennis]|nr:hypothetical protein J6590_024631 [Homalodisca vitripennis]